MILYKLQHKNTSNLMLLVQQQLQTRKFCEFSLNKMQWQKANFADHSIINEDLTHRELHNVLNAPWVALNHNKTIWVVVVDIDEKQFNENAILNGINTIQPNYIITNPQKPLSIQLGYILKKPIFLEIEKVDHLINENTKRLNKFKYKVENKKAVFVYEEIKDKLNFLFNADKNFKGYKAKNPLSNWWITGWLRDESYSTDEILTALSCVEIQKNEDCLLEKTAKKSQNKRDKAKEKKGREHSSNCNNFDDLRLKAYQFVEMYREVSIDKKQLEKMLYAFLEKQQNPEIYKHQTLSERKATLKSIVSFCVNKYKSSNSGKYAIINCKKKEKTMKVKEYILKNYDITKTITKAERDYIARLFELKESTIKNYIHQLRKDKPKTTTKTDEIGAEIDYLRKNKIDWEKIAKMLEMKVDTVKKTHQRYKKKQKKSYLNELFSMIETEEEAKKIFENAPTIILDLDNETDQKFYFLICDIVENYYNIKVVI